VLNFQSLNHGIRVELNITAEENDIPKGLKIVIFRILQEALNNVSKHSRAKPRRCPLGKGRTRLKLGIEMTGPGLIVNDPQSQGRGPGNRGEQHEGESSTFRGGTLNTVPEEARNNRFCFVHC